MDKQPLQSHDEPTDVTAQTPSQANVFSQLRSDVDFLGNALGTILRELEGERLFNLVEQVRSLTKQIRQKSDDSALKAELKALLAEQNLETAERLLRAFTVYFQLINLAEEIHRVRVNRYREGKAGVDAPRSESIAEAIKALKDQGLSYAQARQFVEKLDVQLTITAHPTEVKRYTIRLKLERIASAMRQLSERELSPQEKQAIEAEIYAEISTLWQTRELFTEKPTVLDEVKSALYYYEQSLLDTLPRLMLDVEQALVHYYGDDAKNKPPLPPVLKFRSWIGGDRDGNPFVTPEVTVEAYNLQSDIALKRHLADVDLLVQRLSQTESRITLTRAFRDDIENLMETYRRPARFQHEPYRVKLSFMHRFLSAELDPHNAVDVDAALEVAGYPGGADAYSHDLQLIEETLRLGQGQRAAESFVRPTLYRANIFKFYLAALDLREHSKNHEAAIHELLKFAQVCDDYSALDEQARIDLIIKELASPRPLVAQDAPLSAETRRALEFLHVFKMIQSEYGKEATGGYVVSMTEGVSDVLEVLLLAKQAGIKEIDATPLFETQADLERAPEVLSTLFALPVYRAHVENRGVQEVMIGYSDSNKDAGFLAANWALYQAQEGVAAVCKDAGIALRIFHGRGTSIGRGGGPTGQAILAQPPGSLGGRMRLTEQGEALSDRYADPDLAHRHLEQVVNAFIVSSARDAQPIEPLPEGYRETLTVAAAQAKNCYRQLLETDGFLDFYHTVTPIEEISRLNIGSRPTRRKGEPSLSNLRAIPWVFSWTQCRANLPGWYGLGTGLADIDDALLQDMYKNWPFFQTVIDFAQMSLAKADMDIFETYFELTTPEIKNTFWPLIHEEYKLSAAAVKRVTGKNVREHDQTLSRAIELRNPYVDPMSYLQVELLKRLRTLHSESPDLKDLEDAVQVSLIGISAGMRNTG